MVLAAFYLSSDWKILLKMGKNYDSKNFSLMIFCCNVQQNTVQII